MFGEPYSYMALEEEMAKYRNSKPGYIRYHLPVSRCRCEACTGVKAVLDERHREMGWPLLQPEDSQNVG